MGWENLEGWLVDAVENFGVVLEFLLVGWLERYLSSGIIDNRWVFLSLFFLHIYTGTSVRLVIAIGHQFLERIHLPARVLPRNFWVVLHLSIIFFQ